jgi:colicin import membrane protein
MSGTCWGKSIIIIAAIFTFLNTGCATTFTYSNAPNAPKKCANVWNKKEAFNQCRTKQLNAEAKVQARIEAQEKQKREQAEQEEQARQAALEKAEQERQIIELEEQKAREALREKEELALKQAQEKAARPNTTIEIYTKYFGEPTRKEIINGNDVYWYDDPTQPLYVEFKDSRLISRYLDKVTIREREINRIAEEQRAEEEQQRQIASELEQQRFQEAQEAERQRQIENEELERRRRIGEAFQAFGESFRPKPQVNCSSSPNGFGGFNTNCR